MTGKVYAEVNLTISIDTSKSTREEAFQEILNRIGDESGFGISSMNMEISCLDGNVIKPEVCLWDVKLREFYEENGEEG